MLTDIHPKLPVRAKSITKDFYLKNLGFKEVNDYGDYLMVRKDKIEIHFFEYKHLDPKENYGQVYIRTNDIDNLYQSLVDTNTAIRPNEHLQTKPWDQKEFAILDPDNNLSTFGQNIEN